MNVAPPRFVPIPQGYRFCHDGTAIEPPPELAEAMREALAEPGRFDGEILAVTDIGEDELRAGVARYGHFLAERRAGTYRRVRALAVTGLARLGPWLVFGRRGPGVLQEAGSLELVPSGGVEHSRVTPDGSIAIADQLRDEMVEELGVSPDQATEIRPIGLVIDESEGVIDVVCLLKLNGSREQLIAAHATKGSQEYTSLYFVEADELERWKLWPEQMSRASAAVLSSIDPAFLWTC